MGGVAGCTYVLHATTPPAATASTVTAASHVRPRDRVAISIGIESVTVPAGVSLLAVAAAI
jgi:hypothetical protein